MLLEKQVNFGLLSIYPFLNQPKWGKRRVGKLFKAFFYNIKECNMCDKWPDQMSEASQGDKWWWSSAVIVFSSECGSSVFTIAWEQWGNVRPILQRSSHSALYCRDVVTGVPAHTWRWCLQIIHPFCFLVCTTFITISIQDFRRKKTVCRSKRKVWVLNHLQVSISSLERVFGFRLCRTFGRKTGDDVSEPSHTLFLFQIPLYCHPLPSTCEPLVPFYKKFLKKAAAIGF